MQTSSLENNVVAPKSLAKHIAQILLLCDRADRLINEDNAPTLIHPEMHSLRSRIIKLCRTVLGDEEWGHRILDRVWKSCYYSVICRIRRAALSVEQKNWTEILLKTYVKELCAFANDFTHLRADVCLYVGDLRRYAWLICGDEKYKNLAMLCYRKLAKMDEENGIALNQLGLLVQQDHPIYALLYFLLANNAPVPFHGAYSNVTNLLKQQKEQKKEDENPTIAVVEHCSTYLRQSDFEELSTKWADYILSQLETRHASRVALSINIIILAAIALMKKGKETELISLSKLFFRISEIAIRSLEEWCAPEAETTNLRRRRASSSSSSEESMEEAEVKKDTKRYVRNPSLEADVVSEDEVAEEKSEETVLSRRNLETQHRVQALLVALLHTATSLAPYLYNDNVPSALYCQYENYCRQLIQFLNHLELCLDGKSESIWHLGGSTPWVLLPRFLREFVQSPHTPVEFNDFFRHVPKNSTKESNMKNMAKLRLAHDAQKEYIRTSIPLYVVPKEDILLQRLEALRAILKKGKLIVVIAEGTLRSMDMKKDKPEVRKALRWINAHISKENGRLRIMAGSTPEKCAEKLVAQMRTTSTVFVTLLTVSKVKADSIIKPVTVENVDDFCTRYDKAQKDFLQCQ